MGLENFLVSNLLYLFRYVLQLAIADSVFLLTLSFKVSEDLHRGWIYPEWMCKAKETILFLNYYASILFLMVRLRKNVKTSTAYYFSRR